METEVGWGVNGQSARVIDICGHTLSFTLCAGGGVGCFMFNIGVTC